MQLEKILHPQDADGNQVDRTTETKSDENPRSTAYPEDSTRLSNLEEAENISNVPLPYCYGGFYVCATPSAEQVRRIYEEYEKEYLKTKKDTEEPLDNIDSIT